MDKMSKVTKRKITVDNSNSGSTNGNSSSSNSNNKDSQKRQSVFERLGTKTTAPIAVNTSAQSSSSSGESFCRHWAQNGSCIYGKTCKFANTHILISPSKRGIKKESDSKLTSRSGEDSKRLHSTVVKRASPEVNWDSWDQTDLEYEDEKVLEKRRQLLQRELELQMKRDEKERSSSHRTSRLKHSSGKDKKGAVSSSSSTSASSTSSTDSSSSSDESSTGSSSTSGVGADSKRRKTKSKKMKRGSTSSASDVEQMSRKKIRDRKKEISPPLLTKKSISRNESLKKACPSSPKVLRKASTSLSGRNRKKSSSPVAQRSDSIHRRHMPTTPPPPTISSKSKPTSKLSTGAPRHRDLSPRPSARRSVSPAERKEKHNRSISPRQTRDRERERGRSRTPKTKPRERTPPPSSRRVDTTRTRRKDSPDKSRDKRGSRKNSPKRDNRVQDQRNDDRKKDEERNRNVKDERRTDRKLAGDRSAPNERDKRDHGEDAARAREKAREAAREKERFEALERCRERQREREQLAKEKEKARERGRDEREKDGKSRDYERDIPSLLTITTHNPIERKNERERERSGAKDRKDRDKERLDKERDRPYDRAVDKNSEKSRIAERGQDRERFNDKNERDRGNEKDRRGMDHLQERSRNDKPSERARSYDRERGIDRERIYERGSERERMAERNFDREKERNKVAERPREREREFDRERAHDKDRDRQFDRGNDSERSYERTNERERTSLEKDRSIIRDRGLERVLERERNKSLERGRGSDSERSLERGRERYDRERDARYEPRRAVPTEEKGYDSPYEGSIRRDRSRFPADGTERVHYTPPRDDPRNIRMQPSFQDDRRRRDGQNNRNWEYDDGSKGRDWDFPDNRREWDARNRMRRTAHGEGHIEAEHQAPSEKEAIEPVLADNSLKRPREENESVIPEIKKTRLDEPAAVLEEALSDISDDPDEILNRDDTEPVGLDGEPVEDDDQLKNIVLKENVIATTKSHNQPLSTVLNQPSPVAEALDQRLTSEERVADEEGVVNLDFEEISDEELEEEARANKGLGDALGVDWASLVAETRPKRVQGQPDGEPGAARRRWESSRILQRIGISLKYAGSALYEEIQEKALENANKEAENEEEGELQETKPGLQLQNPVAGVHVTLRLKHAQRRTLFSGVDTFKRALSARRDIAIRRQLCNLPVRSLEIQQAAGLYQWVV